MARMLSDQNKVVLINESGTYASVSGTGQWLGFVQSNDLEENQGVTQIRYQGTASRNVSKHIDGPIDNTGTLTYYPQDFRMLAYALGSCVDGGSPSPYTHVISETNSNVGNAFTSGTTAPFMSFTLEDSHTAAGTGQNLIRTANGCMVNTFKLSASQGEIINCEVGYVAQNVVFTSGAATAVTEDTTSLPYLWSHVKVHIPSGTVYPEVTDLSFDVNNNIEPPHYLNGSRVAYLPYAKNRDYAVEVSQETDSARLKTLYDTYFKGGSEFNMMLELTATTGSQDAFIILSGCKLNPMKNPSPIEGTDTSTISIVPKSCVVSENNYVLKYNLW